jgi:ATP-dependent protease ClpP protease subunit
MFVIDGEISHVTLRRLARYIQNHNESYFHLYINSYGGCTRSALAIHQILRTYSEQGIPIVAQACDEIFSAALIIYLAADERCATKYTRFLIHEVCLQEQRRMTADRYKNSALDLEKETAIIFGVLKSRSKLTMNIMKHKVKHAPDHDWIFGVEEAVKLGIVHHEGFHIREQAPVPESETEEVEIETGA